MKKNIHPKYGKMIVIFPDNKEEKVPSTSHNKKLIITKTIKDVLTIINDKNKKKVYNKIPLKFQF